MRFRHEVKIYINHYDYVMLKPQLKAVMQPDPNGDADGGYRVTSLYFDDEYHSAVAEKLAGVDKRSKWRIRVYQGSADHIKLERKDKVSGLTAKTSCEITLDQYQRLVSGAHQEVDSTDPELMRQFLLISSVRLLKPRVIVDYWREAFLVEHGNVRVTLDSGVRSSMTGTDLFARDTPYIDVLPRNRVILEVKYDEFLPDFVRSLVQLRASSVSSISKYILCMSYSPLVV